MTINWVVRRSECVSGVLKVPGDKSVSHRSVLLGSIADGQTRVDGFLEGEDTRATAAAMRAMGVSIEADGDGALVIEGRGLHGLTAPAAPLDLGNSGTGLRLMAGVLAGQRFNSTLTGDESLNSRPMRRIADPLGQMGAHVETADGGTPPMHIQAAERLQAIHYPMPVASAQVKSCLLLAGLYADGETRIDEPGPCRDHTERMLSGFGYAVRRDGNSVSLTGGGRLTGTHVLVPADISSAAFFLVAASIVPGSDLTLTNVGVNPTRDGVVRILREMGADITASNERTESGEPVADLRVRHAQLTGIDVPEAWVANAIDEFPALFVAAACAHGTTRVTGAEELRVKESDRIGAMADGLTALGVDLTPTTDGMVVNGAGGTGRVFSGGEVDSLGDHRIAMALAVAGAVAEAPVVIRDCANVQTSFPDFTGTAASCGMHVEEVRA